MDFFKVKCQLLIVYFVGFGCQPTILLHTMRQSFEPSYTQIQALLVFFLSFALASQPLAVGGEKYQQKDLQKRCTPELSLWILDGGSDGEDDRRK